MNWKGKVWGRTAQLFKKNDVAINIIHGKRGFGCSKHKHNHKYNMFFVLDGELKIKVWKNDYELVDETTLMPYESTVVEPGEFHKFEVMNDCTALEIYFVDLCEKDIVRMNVGGLL